jgi:hypothetical protein
MPTGDPHCPEEIVLAKKITQLMVKRSITVNLEDLALEKSYEDNQSEGLTT